MAPSRNLARTLLAYSSPILPNEARELDGLGRTTSSANVGPRGLGSQSTAPSNCNERGRDASQLVSVEESPRFRGRRWPRTQLCTAPILQGRNPGFIAFWPGTNVAYPPPCRTQALIFRRACSIWPPTYLRLWAKLSGALFSALLPQPDNGQKMTPSAAGRPCRSCLHH
jgi:hypothetical protein